MGCFIDPIFRLSLKYPQWIRGLKAKGKKIILAIYRPEWWKGFNLLVVALIYLWAIRKDIYVIIVGDNTRASYIFPHAKIRWLPRGELPKYYLAADVFVYTSICEGFGLPLLEAMACGTPVVLTDSPGSRDYAIFRKKPHLQKLKIITTNSCRP